MKTNKKDDIRMLPLCCYKDVKKDTGEVAKEEVNEKNGKK
jgi:hypothetical protein